MTTDVYFYHIKGPKVRLEHWVMRTIPEQGDVVKLTLEGHDERTPFIVVQKVWRLPNEVVLLVKDWIER